MLLLREFACLWCLKCETAGPNIAARSDTRRTMLLRTTRPGTRCAAARRQSANVSTVILLVAGSGEIFWRSAPEICPSDS